MTAAEFKIQFPEVYAQIFNEEVMRVRTQVNHALSKYPTLSGEAALEIAQIISTAFNEQDPVQAAQRAKAIYASLNSGYGDLAAFNAEVKSNLAKTVVTY